MVQQTNPWRVSFFSALILAGTALSACVSGESTDAENTGETVKTPSEGPAIWAVRDADTTIYLFGTIDLLPPDLDWQSGAFRASFEAAELVILETDTGPEAQQEAQQMIPALGLYQDGRTLSQALTDEQKALVAETAAGFGVPIAGLDPLKPWLAVIQISALNAQKQGHLQRQSVAAVIAAKAGEAGTEATYLGKPLGLIKRIADLPEEVHVKMLMQGVKDIQENPDHHDEVVSPWAAGDTAELAEMLHGEGAWADDALYQSVVVERNRLWTQKIKGLLSEETGTVLFAVGIGHLVGEDSLQGMLAETGIEAERL